MGQKVKAILGICLMVSLLSGCEQPSGTSGTQVQVGVGVGPVEVGFAIYDQGQISFVGGGFG